MAVTWETSINIYGFIHTYNIYIYMFVSISKKQIDIILLSCVQHHLYRLDKILVITKDQTTLQPHVYMLYIHIYLYIYIGSLVSLACGLIWNISLLVSPWRMALRICLSSPHLRPIKDELQSNSQILLLLCPNINYYCTKSCYKSFLPKNKKK